MSDLTLSIRIDLPDGGRFGPGKAALLHAIGVEGSISAAVASLGMSYPKGLRLIDELNAAFSAPLVAKRLGGPGGGGAGLTEAGEVVLESYARLCASSGAAASDDLARIDALLPRA